MSKRNDKILIEDMLDSIYKIERYIGIMMKDDFFKDEKTQDAVIRNLEIIGEASKNISSDYKNKYNMINWHEIAGLRNRVIHDYFGVDIKIIWEIVKNDIPVLKKQLKLIA
jgi:uncharacterized protein with HEPN domain